MAEEEDWVAAGWPAFDWAVADWTRLALEVAALAVPVGAALEVAALASLLPEPLAAVAEPVSDRVVADAAAALLLDSDWVADGLADGQLAVFDGLAVAEDDEAEDDEEPDGLAVAEDDPAGELDGAGVRPGPGSLLGLAAGFGGRLDLGGRTCVTSLTTGSGLSGTAEAPSR